MSKQIKLLIIFASLSIAAGGAGIAILNRGEGAKLALRTLIESHKERDVIDAKIIKLRRVQEVGGIVRYYTIEFVDSRGGRQRAQIMCLQGGGKDICAIEEATKKRPDRGEAD